jgi:DMSO/TMAO reductase YedYZ molybdopterin-dependent catalytic subunit
MSLNRREFLIRTGQTGAAFTLGSYALTSLASESSLPPTLAQQQTFPGKEDMIVQSASVPLLETKLQYLRSFQTPNKNFFVRHHYAAPNVDPKNWTLTVEGEVDSVLTVNFDELKKFEEVTLTTWLQCFGNGRSFFNPGASGTQWKYGAVGQAIWKGVRMRDVLLKAGLKIGAKHVAAQGYDQPAEGAAPFIRSIPLEKALDPNTLLVYEMNGEPLPLLNGFPVRVLTPGWGGSASCKWLRKLTVLKEEFVGNFMQNAYRMPATPVQPGTKVDPKDMITATRQPVNSFFTSHAGGETIKAGTVKLAGLAYSGETDIERVDVSTDGGKTWVAANLLDPTVKPGAGQAALLWTQWEYNWAATSGKQSLMVRALDSLGRIQPGDQKLIPWNPSGYNFNAIQKIDVTVE